MVFIIVSSCIHKEKQPYIIIDLAKSINLNGSQEIILNDISTNLKIILTETNDSVLFQYMFIRGITKEDIVVSDKNALYYVNKETGKVSTLVNKRGNGPGEYNMLFDAYVENRDSTVYIYDIHKINIYNFKGNFIKSVKSDSIGPLVILNDGYYAVSFSPLMKPKYALGIYDKSWNLHRKSIPINDRKFAIAYFTQATKFNDDYYYRKVFGDTLYQITSEYDNPYIVTPKGLYKMPENVTASLSELDKSGYRYIQNEYGILISKYYFLSYDYNYITYYDIWNIETSTLIYRNKYRRIEDKNMEGGGIPVLIGDIKINVWPKYVSGNVMYCIIEAENAVKLVPSLPWDTNPIILELTLKNT
jgi:hypothetical protein